MKICHITSVHSRYDTRIFYKECVSLAKAGYDVTFLVAERGKTKPEIRDGVSIVPVEFNPENRIDRIINSPRVLLKKALQIDAEIYHLHDPELLPLARKLKKSGKKVIFDSHEDYPAQIETKEYIPLFLRSVISKVYKSYETGTAKMIDAVIAPCTFNGGVDIFQGRCKNTEIISNATILAEFYYRYKNSITRKGEPFVCHVGSLTHSRGITHLIKAAHKAKVNLILAGSFSPDEYGKEVREMPEFSCVDYRGQLLRIGVLNVYRESSIGAATLLNVGQYNTGDNFATKVYEYMSMGLPVIITRNPFSEKMLKKYSFGIAVDPENIEEISEAITFLVKNPDRAKEMGANGRRAILEEFNWGIEEKKLLALYRKISFLSD